jgi:integrase
MLPEYVHRTVKRGKTYYHFQKHRGTARAGERTRIPYEPDDPKFWETYRKLAAGETIAPGSINALVRDYRASKAFSDLKPATRRDYDFYLTKLEAAAGHMQAPGFSVMDMAAIHDAMAETPVAANHMRSIVRTLFKWGIPRGYGKVNPTDNLRPHKVESDGAHPWPAWAFDLIEKHARREVRTFVALGLYTGQRTADILTMSLTDIRNGKIPVRQSKTDKPLMIPLHGNLQAVIAECRASGFLQLVPGPDGSALDTNRWRALWGRELAKKPLAPIKAAGLSPHGLRKTACVTLRGLGCTVEEIQSITGQSRNMVEHYCKHYDQEAMADRAMDRWMRGTNPA